MTTFDSLVPSADLATVNSPVHESSIVWRRLFLVLGAIALLYAFLAGLRTVSDPDLGWQMATGRWIAQHHHIFSTDVFSYTSDGEPWIYPVGSGLIFYAAYLLGGFALISWLGAAACVGTVALLLRRGSAVSAAIAILTVPLIASRTTPRAEMFTVVLFAAYLSLLWENYRTGRAALWLLPLLMIAWVNLHLGFVSGLGLIAAFVGAELLELPSSETRRREALQRLKRALPWYAAAAAATLVNPWGWGLYQALVRQNQAMDLHSHFIAEWASAGWSWANPFSSFSLRNTNETFNLLLVIVVIAVVSAFLQRRPAAAILMIGAMYETTRHVRMAALTGCVVVVSRISARAADAAAVGQVVVAGGTHVAGDRRSASGEDRIPCLLPGEFTWRRLPERKPSPKADQQQQRPPTAMPNMVRERAQLVRPQRAQHLPDYFKKHHADCGLPPTLFDIRVYDDLGSGKRENL